MRRILPLLFAAVLCLPLVSRAESKWAPPPPPADAPAELRAAVQQADDLYCTRDKAGHTEKGVKLLRDAAEKHPDSYAVQWRLARFLFWASEGSPNKEEHRALGEEGWEAGKKAVELNPNGAEGLYFKGICVGEVAHSVGVVTALRKGLEGEFRDPVLKAEKLAPLTDYGGIYRALGRYKFELPWPKRDLDASVKYLRKALELYPDDLRSRVYLAETLAKRDSDGDEAEGKKLLKEALDAPIGKIDPPEDRRAKGLAKDLAKRLEWELK